MRSRVIPGLIAAVALAGCAGPAPRPSPTAGMAWVYYETPEEGAKLAFGLPGTDDVPMMLTCPLKTGRVTVWVDNSDAAARSLELVSGRVASRIPAQMEPDELVLMGHTTLADPALRAFGATGRISVRAGGGRRDLPAADTAAVRRFLERCQG